jgi:hypothetical protein
MAACMMCCFASGALVLLCSSGENQEGQQAHLSDIHILVASEKLHVNDH